MSDPRTQGSASDRSGLLERLIERALEAIDRGEQVDVAALCADAPELREAVAAALGRLAELPIMHHEATSLDTAVGRVLGGRYQLEEPIGSGAMGVVYRALDRHLGREVAIKLLRPELVAGAKMDQRLAREGQVLASIRHRNVVMVHDCGRADDGRTFLVMERLHGVGLSQLLRNGSDGAITSGSGRMASFRQLLGDGLGLGDNDVRQVVRWVIDAADGVQAAHDARVVHRDIKPSNLFLERTGRLVVLDFGIVTSSVQPTLGHEGSPLGTPAYMAPEQLDAGVEPDVRCDVYGLAATLYHLLTGRAPFVGSIQQVLTALARGEPEPADRVRPGLPTDLVAIVEKGMARSPARRYATAAALRDDLSAWLEYRPVTARRVSWLTSGLRRAGRSPSVRAAVLVLAVVAGVLAWWQLDAAHGRRVAARVLALWAKVPPSLINELPQYRATSNLRTDVPTKALLDELVELSPDPGSALALRAVFRADAGDFAAAAADVQRIADFGDAPFAAAAASAYRAGRTPDEQAQGDSAPPVGGADDRFLLVLHAMRSDGARPLWVEQLLERDDGLATHLGFAEVHLLLRDRRTCAIADFETQVREFERLEQAVTRLDAQRTRPSAMTSQVLTNALIAQGRLQESRASAAAGRTLAPQEFVLWKLGGTAALQCGDAKEAADLYRRSIELQPRSVHSRVMLCDALLELRLFDDAERLIEATPFAQAKDGAVQKARQQGNLLFLRAEDLHTTSPDDASQLRAQELFREAREAFRRAREAEGSGVSFEELVCDGRLGEPCAAANLFDLMAQRPIDGRLLEQVATLMPGALGAEDTMALARLFRAQATWLGGRNR